VGGGGDLQLRHSRIKKQLRKYIQWRKIKLNKTRNKRQFLRGGKNRVRKFERRGCSSHNERLGKKK